MNICEPTTQLDKQNINSIITSKRQEISYPNSGPLF